MSKVRERLQARLAVKKVQSENNFNNLIKQCQEALDDKKYETAVKFGEEALKILPEQYDPCTRDSVLYNLGIAYQTFDIVKALWCFKELEKGISHLTPDMLEKLPIFKNMIVQKAVCELANGNFKEAKNTIKKVGGVMEKLIALQIELHKKTSPLQEIYNKSLKINADSELEKINLTLLQGAISAQQGNTERVINSVKILSNMKTQSYMDESICKFIASFRIGGKFTEGIDFLNYTKKNYPGIEKSIDYFTLYNLFIIHEKTANYDLATNYLIKLEAQAGSSEFQRSALKQANTVRYYTELEKKNFKAAKEILNKTDLQFKLHNKLLSKLEKENFDEQANSKVKGSNDIFFNAIIEAEINNDSSLSTKIEEGLKIDSESFPEITEIKIEDLDPKKIHEYFRNKKELLAKKDIESGKARLSLSWVLPNGIKYDVKQTDMVYKVEGREHYYICIRNNLKLGSEFIEAMKKGVVSKSYSSTGIKFFKNSDSVECVELKINGGNRAWSKNMYINPEGDYLVMIDGYGNHVAAGKAAQEGMKITSVSPRLTHRSIASDVSSDDLKYRHHTTFSEHKDYSDHDDVDLAGDTSIA